MSLAAGPGIAMRQRILDGIRKFPGVHVRELARQLDSSVALVEYHLPFLQEQGLIELHPEGAYLRLFAGGEQEITAADREWLALLRQPFPVKIVLALLEMKGPMRHGELADMVDMGKSKLSFHLRKLETVNIVSRSDDGLFGLSDAKRTARLLLQNPPTTDVADRFTSFWNSFYGTRR